MRFHLKILSLILLLGVAACVNLPEAEFSEPRIVPETAHPAPMTFSKLKVEIPAGTDLGYYSDFSLDKTHWFMVPANRRLLSRAISKEELNTVFSETMGGMGYDVADYLNLVFDEDIEDEYLRAEYRIGGKIIEAKMDLDRETEDRFGTISFGQSGVKGELYLKIKWGVYDALRRTTVYQTITEGRGKQGYGDPEGMTLLVNSAFEMAAHNLGADEGFYNLLVKGIKPATPNLRKKYEDRPLKYNADEHIIIKAAPLSHAPFAEIAEQSKKAAVLVQAGAGHGSGFFISHQGHIITNQHVVGNAQRVRIVTADKKEKLIAQVLRVDQARDVALLKLEEMPSDIIITTLPIRTQWPAVSEDIYAIGAPKSTRLQDTISKGIVSAHRKNYRMLSSNQDFIQGDVPTHGGNSGGPLVDKNGNLVGITVAGLYMHEGKRSADLNFFIPIESALKALNIELEKQQNQKIEAPINLVE